MKIIIYGAKSLALGIGTALQTLYPEYTPECFLVSSMQNNPTDLMGLPVYDIAAFTNQMTEEEKKQYRVLIGTPEDLHPAIAKTLEEYGYCDYICMDSHKEARLMEAYFAKLDKFPSIHSLQPGQEKISLQVYMAKFYKDRVLMKAHQLPAWAVPLQVGAALTDVRVTDLTDHQGDNISKKNVNYCELTALYWMWKNQLMQPHDGQTEYYGLFHYRRILDIKEDDLYRLKANDVDAVLQFPTLHEPDISEHHARYMKEDDWNAMRSALEELQPEYAKAFTEILAQPYFYNYNMIIAKRQVLADYCAWLFPILERTEELSTPKGWERKDRYIGYLGENLMTLYFLYHRDDLKVYHAGRWMLT